MKSSPPSPRFAPDPAALAQGHRALARARRWTIAGVSVGLLTLAAFALLAVSSTDAIADPTSATSLVLLLAIGLLLTWIAFQPGPAAQSSTEPRPRAPLPSAGLHAIAELLERACARLERGQNAVFDWAFMEFTYHALVPRDRAWLDARNVPRSRLFDVASNWAEADDPDDPELCRALHREVSLMLAAIYDREQEDPYRAGLRTRSLVDLIGVTWLRTYKTNQNAALRDNRRLGAWAIGAAISSSLGVAALAGLSRVTNPLTICMPGHNACRSAFGATQLELAAVVLVVLAPLVLWSVSAAHRLVAHASFADALPALAPNQRTARPWPEFTALRQRLARRRTHHQRWSRRICLVLLPLGGLLAALNLADDVGRSAWGPVWLEPDPGRAAAALMISTVAALLLASIDPVRRGHRRLCARLWLAWLRRRSAGNAERDVMLGMLVHHRVELATSVANRRESLDLLADVLTDASFRDRDAVLEQVVQARARACTLDGVQLQALEDTLIACERTLADDRVA